MMDFDLLGRTLVVGVLTYAALIVLLRVAGKRTLAKWNAFDLVVTVSLGSSMATTILSSGTSLVQGVLVFALLVGLQYAITWMVVRFGWFDHLVTARPTLLVYRGRYRHEAMRRERVPESEIVAAVRGRGISSMEDVGAVVLETDGSFSVLGMFDSRVASALRDVGGFDQDAS